MKKKDTIRSVVVVAIAIAAAVVSSFPVTAVAEEGRADVVELLVIPIDDEAVIEFIPIRAVVSWDPSEIEIESGPAPHGFESEAPDQMTWFDPDPAVPPTAPRAVVLVPPLLERSRRHPARFSIHPIRIAQR